MDLRDLRYFSMLADELHFGRAAERVGISTPGLSAAIKRLEGECGGLLFERLPRGVFLTPAGRALRAHAERLLALHDAACAAVSTLVDGPPSSLRFGQIMSVPEELAAPVIAQLVQRDAAARYVMTRIEWLAGVQALLSGDVGVSLLVSTGLDRDRTDGLIELAPIGEDPVVPIVRIGHPRLGADCSDDLALTTEEWIEFDPLGPYDEALESTAMALSGRRRHVTAVAPDTRMMFGLVASSDRVGWCPASFLPFVRDTVRPLLGLEAWRVDRTLMLARRVGTAVPAWDDLVAMLALRHRTLVGRLLESAALIER